MTMDLCPRFHRAIELVGSRWTGAILQVLGGDGARFSLLRDAIPDITDRMLSERLRVLEAEGLVIRTVLPDPPVRVEYTLTPKGRELHASLAAIARWAERWLPAPAPPAARPAPPASRRPASRSGRPAARPGRRRAAAR